MTRYDTSGDTVHAPEVDEFLYRVESLSRKLDCSLAPHPDGGFVVHRPRRGDDLNVLREAVVGGDDD